MEKKKFVLKKICSCIQTQPHDAALHDVKLKGRGPTDARLMIVGMAPGRTEIEQGQYFVGSAGQQLKSDLLVAGIAMEKCRIQNVGCYWPPAHKLYDLPKEKLEEGYAQLIEDIKLVQPELIIACGTEAMEFLTGKQGITKWAGSLLPLSVEGHSDLPPATVIPTVHPSAVLRSWDYHVIFLHDIRRAASVLRGDFPGPLPRKLVTVKNVSTDEYRAACQNILAVAKAGLPLACDIETLKGSVSCISFSPNPAYSVSIHGDDKDIYREILETDCPKIWCNAMYDTTFLEAKEGVVPRGPVHDVQLLWHAINPELACSEFVGKSLALLTHLLTNDNYYKDAREDWKKVADWNAFYEYNAMDSAVTFEVWEKLTAQLNENQQATYDFELSLLPVYRDASIRGIKIDTARKGAMKSAAKRRLGTLTEQMRELLGDEEYNPRSHPQNNKWLKKLGSTQPNTDKEALLNIVIKTPDSEPLHKFAVLLKEFKQVSKAHDTYYSFGYDDDGRVRTNWIIPGTETGRMANSKSIIFKGGVNLMTIPRGARQFFIADDGYKLVYADLSQAEARIVAYLAGCEPMIEAFVTGRDLYKTVAAQMFHKPYEEITYDERYLAKRCVLGLLYGMGPKTWMVQTNIDKGFQYMTLARAKELHALFFETFPEIKAYHRYIEKLVQRDKKLTNIFGRSRNFRPRNGTFSDGSYREAYDYLPQAMVPDVVNRAVLRIAAEGDSIHLHGQIHDAGLWQVRDNEDFADNVGRIQRHLQYQFAVQDIRGRLREFTIPVEVKVGLNWGDHSDDNPEGLQLYGE